MKYLKTNYSIYKIKDHEHNGFELVWRCEVKNKPGMYYGIKEHEVINYGDTIQDLCDEFVIVLPNKTKLVDGVGGMNKYETAKYHTGKKTVRIFGAIWTYTGLIYVAEFNEKGELELL